MVGSPEPTEAEKKILESRRRDRERPTRIRRRDLPRINLTIAIAAIYCALVAASTVKGSSR